MHRFDLKNSKLKKIRTGGVRIDATADNFPALSGISLSYLEIKPNAFREPHWHPNADELSYCLEGQGVITIFTPGSIHDSFTISAGDISFVPQNCLHHIQNTGNEPLKMLVCFDHERPEDLNSSQMLKSMPDTILGATFHETASFFDALQSSKAEDFIAQLSHSNPVPLAYLTNRFKLSLEAVTPQVNVKGGTVKMSNHFLLPTLHGLSVYSLVLHPKGAREPHWHPNAGELNYLIQGRVKINLLSPKGVESFELEPGQISYLPKGYLHHIENISDEEVRMAIFFNHPSPSDIGISGCLGAYPNDILEALFGVSTDYFKTMPKYQQDLFVVSGGG